MKTLREPVIFSIEGISFEVNVARQLLRQTNKTDNLISFSRDMQDKGTHYELLYDLDEQSVQREFSGHARIKTVQVPQMTELDPEGMALAFGKHLDGVLGRSDYEVIVDAELVNRRHQGMLPEISIAGQSYTVDLRLKELRHRTDLSRSISLKQMELSPEGDEYLFFYDFSKHEMVELDPKLTGFPEQVVLAKIPNEIGLDPVATAAIYGIDERQLLRCFPISPQLNAQLVPLADTGVPALISRNQETLRREHRQILGIRKPHRGQRL